MKHWQVNRVYILTLLLAVSLLITSNAWGVLETSEARYAEISREMFRSGDWLHPKLLEIYHYHKPPVTYWITAGAYVIFGINAFAARFFLVIAYCLQVFLIFKVAQLLFNDNSAGYFASHVYATTPMILISVRGLTTDAYLATFVLLSVYAWLKYLRTGNALFLYGVALAAGLAFMTKGPVGLLIPALSMLGLRNIYPVPQFSALNSALAILLFLLIAFTWFAFLAIEDPRLADYFFFRHFIDRVAHAEVFARKEPWYYYLPIAPLVFLPWVPLFFGGLFRLKVNNAEKHKKLARTLAIGLFLIPLIIFSLFTSKLVLYILPLSIGFSLVTGYFLASGIHPKLFWLFTGSIFFIYVCLTLLPYWATNFLCEGLLPGMPLAALLLSIGALFVKARKELILSILSVLFSVTLIFYASDFFRQNSIEVNALSPVSSFLKSSKLDKRNILVYNELLPSLAFELDRSIVSVYAGNRSLQRETQFEKDDAWRSTLINATDSGNVKKLSALLSGKSVLITKKALPMQVKLMPGRWHKRRFGKWLVYYN